MSELREHESTGTIPPVPQKEYFREGVPRGAKES